MADPLAVPADIAAVWRPLTTDETQAATGLISQASAMLRMRAPGIDARIAADDDGVVGDAVKAAVVNAVKRVLTNPEAMRQFQNSETTGPFTDQKGGTFDDSVATGALYFTGADLFGLVPSVSGLPQMARVKSGYPSR